MIDGPGVWITCMIGKEKQCVAEIYNLFHSIGDELWPQHDSDPALDDSSLVIEDRIRRELDQLRLPPRERRFRNCGTGTSCVVYMQCNKPVDPVRLVLYYLDEVARTGVVRTKYAQRFTPVSAAGSATTNSLCSIAASVIPDRFAELCSGPTPYKVEMKIRNHNSLDKQEAINQVVKFVPPGHIVDLDRPELVILVEIFKNVCGVSVVPKFIQHQKFSPLQIVQTRTIPPDQAA